MASPFVFKNIIIRKFSYDPDAVQLFNRMTTQPSSSRKLLISNFFKGLKSDLNISSLSSSFDAIWFFASHSNQAAQLNWVKDSHNITEVNSPSWTLDLGYTGNGSTTYLNSNYNPSTGGVSFTLNNGSFGVYCRNNISGLVADIGCNDAVNFNQIYSRIATNLINLRVNQGTGLGSKSSSDSSGLTGGVRNNSTTIEIFKNGLSLGTNAINSTSIPSLNFFIMCQNASGTPVQFTTRNYSFAFVGSNTINQLLLFNRVETFLDAINAGVI